MTFKSKRTITSMATGVALIIGYFVYASGSAAPAPDDIKAWAIALLVFIGISIVVMIAIQILFHIIYSIGFSIKERDRDNKEVEQDLESFLHEDEMDRLISLKSVRVGYLCVGAGFAALLIALALGVSVVVALHIAFVSLALGGTLEGAVSVYLFEKGLTHA